MRISTIASTLVATLGIDAVLGAAIALYSDLEERESPCLTDDDCGGIDTQAPASSMSDLLGPTTTTNYETIAPITALPTAVPTLSSASRTIPWTVYTTPSITAVALAAICSEAIDGQFQCENLKRSSN
jgi:hypothetical protein